MTIYNIICDLNEETSPALSQSQNKEKGFLHVWLTAIMEICCPIINLILLSNLRLHTTIILHLHTSQQWRVKTLPVPLSHSTLAHWKLQH